MVKEIGPDAQLPLQQLVGPVDQSQVLQAAADRALVHGQGGSCFGVGAGKFDVIEDVQVFQRGWAAQSAQHWYRSELLRQRGCFLQRQRCDWIRLCFSCERESAPWLTAWSEPVPGPQPCTPAADRVVVHLIHREA